MEPYFPLLYDMNRRGVRYVVIGTGALWLHLKEFRDRPLADCDLFVPSDDYANLTQFVRAAIDDRWTVQVWGEDVTLPLTESQLKGKIYLRCSKIVASDAFDADTHNDPRLLVVDITYEMGWASHYSAASATDPSLGLAFDDMNSERVMCAPPNVKLSATSGTAPATATPPAAASGKSSRDVKTNSPPPLPDAIARGVAAATAGTGSGGSGGGSGSAGSGSERLPPAPPTAIPTASLEHVLALKRIRNKARDRMTIIEVEAITGPFRRSTGRSPPRNEDDPPSAGQSVGGGRGGPSIAIGGGSDRVSGVGGVGVRSAIAQARAKSEYDRHAAALQRSKRCCGDWNQFEVLLLCVIVLCILRMCWEFYHTRFLHGFAVGPASSLAPSLHPPSPHDHPIRFDSPPPAPSAAPV